MGEAGREETHKHKQQIQKKLSSIHLQGCHKVQDNSVKRTLHYQDRQVDQSLCKYQCGRAIEGEGSMLRGDGATNSHIDSLIHLHPSDEYDVEEECSANFKSVLRRAIDPKEQTSDKECEDKRVEEPTAHSDLILHTELKVPLGEVPYLPWQRYHVRTALPAPS